MLNDTQRRFEDVRLHDLELNGVCDGRFRTAGLGVCLVDFAERFAQFAADIDPFYGLEVVVLEKDYERHGAEDGSVLAVELGFAEFGPAVRERLGVQEDA